MYRMDRNPPKLNRKCLNPLCDTKVYARGLCSACYHAAGVMVKAGKTSWPELESLGKAVPRNRPGPGTRFEQWLSQDGCELVEQVTDGPVTEPVTTKGQTV